jgi:hypothetical protein
MTSSMKENYRRGVLDLSPAGRHRLRALLLLFVTALLANSHVIIRLNDTDEIILAEQGYNSILVLYYCL